MANITRLKGNSANFWHLAAGVLMALLGVYVWFNPEVSLMALALYLGVVFIVVGTSYLIASFSFQSGWYLVVGILDLLVGVIFVTNLGVTVISLPIIFALWCMAVGVVQMVAAFQLRNTGNSWKWSLTAGVLGVLFGFVLLMYPVVSAFTLTALMGAYIFLYGVVEVVEYFDNRKEMAVVTVKTE